MAVRLLSTVLVINSGADASGIAVWEGLVGLGNANGVAAGTIASSIVVALALVLACIRLVLVSGVSSVEDSKDLDVMSSDLCHDGAEVLLVYGVEFKFKFLSRVRLLMVVGFYAVLDAVVGAVVGDARWLGLKSKERSSLGIVLPGGSDVLHVVRVVTRHKWDLSLRHICVMCGGVSLQHLSRTSGVCLSCILILHRHILVSLCVVNRRF